MQRFTGPYSMPRTSAGRVPNTSGGKLPPRGPGRSGVPNTGPMGRRSTAGFRRGRMVPIPSPMTRGMAAAMSALGKATGPKAGLLGMVFDLAVKHAIRKWYEDVWAEVGSQLAAGYYPQGDGWTQICQNLTCQPTQIHFKVGINPGALTGKPNVGSSPCVNATNVANNAWGTDVPAGANLLQLVCSTVALPNNGGLVFTKWQNFNVGGSTKKIEYFPGKIVLPINSGDLPFTWAVSAGGPTVNVGGGFGPGINPGFSVPDHSGEWVGPDGYLDPGETAGPDVGDGSGPYTPPYSEPSVDVDIDGDGVKVTDGVHNNLPPNDPETKGKTPWGKTLQEARRSYGKVTELGDVLDCVAKSIPGNPCKGLSLQAKAKCISENAHKADPAGAAMCIMLDQMQDAMIGKLSRAASDAARKAGAGAGRPYPLGPFTGSFGARMR